MSELEDLEEIAIQTAHGNGDLNDMGRRFHRPRETHKPPAKAKKRCVREKERTANGKHVRYSAREYPL